MPPRFDQPEVVGNEEGWGPPATDIELPYLGVPYAPFAKGERLGKVADWSQGTAKYGGGAVFARFFFFFPSLSFKGEMRNEQWRDEARSEVQDGQRGGDGVQLLRRGG